MKDPHQFSLGEAIQAFLEKHGIQEEAKVQEIIADWERLMGAPIAANTDKIWFQQGTLYVRMKSPMWKNELSLARSKIRLMLNQQMGQEIVKEVKIV